jgi:hypothetical protein
LTKIFKNKSNVLFIGKTDRIEERGRYTLVLSPEFYWSKKVSLPVKKEKDALKLAPSVYEGFLPDGEYSYAARKEGDDFVIIAYDKKKISSELEQVIPHKSDIAAIYFAQDALPDIKECVAVNDKVALSNMDDVLMQIPRACTNTERSLEEMLKDENLVTKRKVTLSSLDNALLTSSEMKVLSALFALLFLGFLSEYVVYKKALNGLESKRASIIEEYNMPKTSVQLKSIKKSLLKKFETQKSMRDILAGVSKIVLAKGEYIQSIEENRKDAQVKIYLPNKTRVDEIKKILSKSLKIEESRMVKDTLVLRVKS